MHQNCSVNQMVDGNEWGIFISKQLQLLSEANLAGKKGSRNSADGNALL